MIVSCWFDISLIRIRATRGVVHFQGHIQSTSEQDPDVRSEGAKLRRLDGELRMLPGFRGAAYLFDNWRRDDTGNWQFLGPKKEREASKRRT